MKRKLIMILTTFTLLFTLLTPFSAYALSGVNEEAMHTVDNAEDYTQVCPDLHYILDDSLPYKMLFPGASHFIYHDNWHGFLDYDLVFVQCSDQPIAHFGGGPNMDLSGDNPQVSYYGYNFGDEQWTLLKEKTWTRMLWIANDQNTAWYDCILASNFDATNINDKVIGDYEDYLYYFNIPESKYSVIDYNGHIAYQNIFLTYLKMIGHVFVLRFLKPFFDYIVAEPILLLIVLLGFSVTVISLLIAIYNVIISKNVKRRRKRG